MSDETFMICRVCLNVDGVGSGLGAYCLGQDDHDLVEAVVENCPWKVGPTRGRYANRTRLVADRRCLELDPEAHGPHHYGDPERRHFSVPVLTVEGAT